MVLTSNRTRDVHDALKRRCLYHWVEHPDFEREVAIVRLKVPEVEERLARQVTAAVQAIRGHGPVQGAGCGGDHRLGPRPRRVGQQPNWTRPSIVRTLGSIAKYREDVERVAGADLGRLVQEAVRHG